MSIETPLQRLEILKNMFLGIIGRRLAEVERLKDTNVSADVAAWAQTIAELDAKIVEEKAK
jgi:hypothetical protein